VFIPRQPAAAAAQASVHYTRSDCREMSTLALSQRRHLAHEILLNLATHIEDGIVTRAGAIIVPWCHRLRSSAYGAI